MRAPYQVLAIPYRREPERQFCVFYRSDNQQCQFVSGGGEDDETPMEAIKREIKEELGINAEKIRRLVSMAYIPAGVFEQNHQRMWPKDTYVVPEYAFAFECDWDIRLSGEHTAFEWLSYEEAKSRLTWDSNKTALYELTCRLQAE